MDRHEDKYNPALKKNNPEKFRTLFILEANQVLRSGLDHDSKNRFALLERLVQALLCKNGKGLGLRYIVRGSLVWHQATTHSK